MNRLPNFVAYQLDVVISGYCHWKGIYVRNLHESKFSLSIRSEGVCVTKWTLLLWEENACSFYARNQRQSSHCSAFFHFWYVIVDTHNAFAVCCGRRSIHLPLALILNKPVHTIESSKKKKKRKEKWKKTEMCRTMDDLFNGKRMFHFRQCART